MTPKIPHFSGNFHSSFLERFLVFYSGPEKPPVVSPEEKDLANALKNSGVLGEYSGLKENIEKMISKKEIIKEELGIEPNDFEEGMLKVNNRVKSFFHNNPLRSQLKNITSEISAISQDVYLSEAEKNTKISVLKSQEKSLAIQFTKEMNVVAENAWREKFPENSGVASFQKMQNTFMHSRAFVEARKKNRIEMKNNISHYPHQSAEISAYVKLRADVVLEDAEKMTYLHSDPFYKIVQFVQSGGNIPLSLADRKVLKQIQSPSLEEKYAKKISGDVKRVGRLTQKTKNGKTEETAIFQERVHTAQANILINESTYQLAMIEIAKRADRIINNDKTRVQQANKNRAEELGISIEQLKKTTDLQKSIYELSPEKQKFLEKIVPQGHIVKNEITDAYSGDTPTALGVDKVNLENFFLYEVVGTWGIVTALANIMVAFNNGNWEAAVPYILGGAAATYMSADMVFNHTLDKMREPEKMAQFIFQEKDNENYEEFFGNDDEVTLWDNIQWPEKSGEKAMKDAFSGIKKRKKKDKKNLSDQEQEKIEYDEKVNHLSQSETLDPLEFAEGGRLESYLPNIIVDIHGNEISKSQFLRRLDMNRGGVQKNSMRYKMFKETLSRLGDRDSYVPYLHTLHDYAQKRSESPRMQEERKTLQTTTSYIQNLKSRCPTIGASRSKTE